MRLTYLPPDDANVVEVATDLMAATRDLVGTDAEVFGRRDGGRTVLVLEVPDSADRATLVAAVVAQTGLVPQPDREEILAADPIGGEA